MPALPRSSLAVTLWLVGAIAIALIAFLRWPQEEWLKTGFDALLPAGSDSPWQIRASAAATTAYEGQLVILVSGDNAEAVNDFIYEVDDTLRSGGYVDARLEEAESGKWQALSERLYPHRWSLLAPVDRDALKRNPAARLEHFRRLLYSPLGGSIANTLEADPAGLYRNFLQAATPEVELVPGALEADGRVIDIALYQVQSQPPGAALSAGLYTTYLMLCEQATARGLVLHATGAPLYTAYGVLSAEREISTIGLVSLIVLVLALIAVLRSLSAILLTLICVSSGVLVGWVMTVALLQQIHIITLVFGVTIIGIAADYAFHYLAHTVIGTDGERALDSVFTGLATSTATSVLAFIGLTVIPFPGIRQIGVFMAAGLFGSFLTVCLLFPMFYRPKGRGVRLPAFCTRSQVAWPASRGILLLLSLVAISGLLLLEPRADIRDFYAAPVKLQTDQEVIEHALGGAADSRYLLVRADTVEALLQTEEGLRDAVGAGGNPNGAPLLKGISGLVPSAARQRENVALLGALIEGGHLQAHLQELGFSDAAQQHILAEFPLELRSLELSSLDGLQLPLGVGGFLGCTIDNCASWLPLPGRESAPDLTGILDTYPGVTMVDPIEDINRLLARYRGVVLMVLGVGSGLIILLLTLLWGWRLALRVVMLPALSCVFTLAAFGYAFGYYTIINLLALLLIVGVSLDYAIFRAFTRSEDQPATSLAISLSAITSVLAFGMLGFSSTPLIASFGQTIAVGLVFAYLLSWFRFGACR